MADTPQPRCGPGLTDSHADGRHVAVAAQRNAGPIKDALAPLVKDMSGVVLEIGSGTGQHVAEWAQSFPQLTWQPSDPFDAHLASIAAWQAHTGAANLRPPVRLDAAQDWADLGPLAGVISVNVIHIAPWSVAQGIVSGAGRMVDRGGLLLFYGPFRENGAHTGDGNVRFDASLRGQNPAWGIRDIADLSDLAAAAGFSEPEIAVMPANNRMLCFRRR